MPVEVSSVQLKSGETVVGVVGLIEGRPTTHSERHRREAEHEYRRWSVADDPVADS